MMDAACRAALTKEFMGLSFLAERAGAMVLRCKGTEKLFS
jgi:hypothetical protein